MTLIISSSWHLLMDDEPLTASCDLVQPKAPHLKLQCFTGKGRELADMMERRKVDILCVQETRWKGSKARSIGAGFKLFYYGVDSKRNGVGVVLKEKFVRNVLEVGCELEEKERFWSELDEVIAAGKRVVIGAHFNVGEGNIGDKEVMGKFGVKERNLEGQMVVLPDDWETTAEVIRETGRKVLGVSSGRRKEDKEIWWWNEEVLDSIQRKRLAKKKCDMDRTEENRQEYKELQCRVKREVSKAKQKTGVFLDNDVCRCIVICSESREQVEENLERWRFALERRGMKVSRSKTEYVCVNEREGSGTVRLQGEEVKKVQEFKYLGSTVQSNGESGREVMTEDGLSKGFGFLSFKSSQDAMNSISQMIGRKWGRKRVYVGLAQRREEHQAHL
ncbi:hypothetical protein QTP86_006291 [Hemibagrus guttatus]|nr:hypothetical protein QTP86_006291 [Hemibagrus guttatus]